MIERDHGGGGRWYVAAVYYPTALMAKSAWERVDRKLPASVQIGLYRTMQESGPERIDSGSPPGSHQVVAVGLVEAGVRRAERLLRDGTPWVPTDSFCDALIARRARVLLDRRLMGPIGKGGERLKIRRPIARSGRLDETGVMYEANPGEG